MKRYVISTIKSEQGDHEVHESSCTRLPAYTYQKDLGYHFNCRSAIELAKNNYEQVNGCHECNRVCHTAEVEV